MLYGQRRHCRWLCSSNGRLRFSSFGQSREQTQPDLLRQNQGCHILFRLIQGRRRSLMVASTEALWLPIHHPWFCYTPWAGLLL